MNLDARWRELGRAADGSDFGSPDAEYSALDTAVALIPRPARALLVASGADRARYVHGQCTNDIQKLTPGQGCYAAFLSPKGQVVFDAEILNTGEEIELWTDEERVDSLATRLSRSAVFAKVEFERSSRSGVTLQGPGSSAALAAAGLGEPGPNRFDHLESAGVRVARVDRSGRGGFDVLGSEPELLAAVERLLTAGAAPAGHVVLDIARIEAGIPLLGVDLDEKTLLPETGLDHGISYTKGCYIGQETMARLNARGHVNRHMVSLAVDGDLEVGDELFRPDDPKPRGRVTSVARSPRLGRVVGLGWVPRGHHERGASLSTSRGGLVEVVAAGI